VKIRVIRDCSSFWSFEHSGFDIVSNFVLRISDFFFSAVSAIFLSPRDAVNP